MSNVRKNALASYANTGVTAVLGIIVNPILLSGLGQSAFGAWKAIQRFLDVGSAANGGAMQALKWVIAFRAKDDDIGRKRRDVGAALIVLLYWTPALAAVAAGITVLLPALVRGLPAAEMPAAYWACAILGFNLLISSFAALPDAVLIGTNQGYRSMVVTTVVLVLTNCAMLGAVVLGMDMVSLAIVTVAGTVANGGITFFVARRRVRWLAASRPEKQDLRDLSRFSGWVLTWSLTNRVMLSTEVILLSVLASVALVSSYTFTGYVAQFALAIALMTTSAQMPKLGALLGAGEHQAAASVAREARELAIAAGTGFACMTILFNEAFVEAWAGEAQFLGQPVNVLMAVALFQLSVIRTDGQIQDTGLDVSRKVLLGIAMVGISIAAAAAAYSLTRSIEWMFVGLIAGRLIGSIGFPFLANRALRSTHWPVGRFLVGATLVAICAFLAPYVRPHGWLWLVITGVLGALVLAAVIMFSVLSRATRRKLFRRGGRRNPED